MFDDSFFDLKTELPEKKKSKKKKRKLATFDIETDPFLYGREPQPFSCGFYCGDFYKEFWGENCLEDFQWWLLEQPDDYHIYAHNGGTFDFIYLLRMGWFDKSDIKPNIINGRIVKAYFFDHIFQDSYAIMPVPLSKMGAKLGIDYDLMEEDKREENKDEILKYLKADCVVLYEAVEQFIERFGNKLTIGQVALNELQKRHPFERVVDDELDELFRGYYFGGRVQCFQTGVIQAQQGKEIKVYDVNSMYPYVMAKLRHPISFGSIVVDDSYSDYLNIDTGELKGAYKGMPYFVTFEGENYNGIPSRDKNGSLNFTRERGTFKSMSHELTVAIKYDLVKIEKIKELIICPETINFDDYVSEFIQDKIEAKKQGDKFAELCAKLLLNSAYGKTAQNWKNFKDACFCPDWNGDDEEIPMVIRENRLEIENWELENKTKFDGHPENYDEPPLLWVKKQEYNNGEFFLWERPLREGKYYDVAIGASITAAARAVLLEAIVNAETPIYCDTDSVICEELTGVEFDDKKLGAWDLEGTGDTVYVYAKKVYSLYKDGEPYRDSHNKPKMASKGFKCEPEDIKRLCEGQTITYANMAPSFKLGKKTEFVQRILGAEKHTKIFDKYGAKILEENIESD